MKPVFSFEETNLMCIYVSDSRTGLIANLKEMSGYLSDEETELRELTDSTIAKLHILTDAEFAQLDLVPDFDP